VLDDVHTVELHLSGLIGTASHPDMQKIRKIGFLYENRLHWQYEVEKILQMVIFGYIFIYVQTEHYSGDDQLSPLTKSLGIPCQIWESFDCY
jgi:hypothetical protein